MKNARKSESSRAGKPPTQSAQARLLRIHDRLNVALRRARRVNCRVLGEDLGVSAKTIQRDITYMRETLELPIEYDSGEKSYGYRHEVPHFPLGPDLSVDERLALLVASRAMAEFSGVALAQELKGAYDKITGGLFAGGDGFCNEPIEHYVSVRTPGAGVVRDRDLFVLVRRALLEHVELTVNYQAKQRPLPTQRRLQPLHLACIENRWLLVARDVEKQDVRTYVLARMSNARLTEAKFDRPAGFDPEQHFGTSFGSWTGKGNIIVKLRIEAAGAHHVLERKWHKTQQVTSLPGGQVEVTFALSDLHDVTRWILGFGKDCEVLKPAELRTAIADEGAAMAARR